MAMSTSMGIQPDMTEEGTYIPGTCNIGKEEVRRRKNGAIGAMVIALLIASGLFFFHADKIWRFLVFIPFASAAISFQQWVFKFCVGFGMKGIFNFKHLGESTTIEEEALRKLDKAKATKMIVTGLVFSLVLTIVFYLIP